MACGRTVGKTGHRFSSYLRRGGLAAAALFCFATFAAPGSADDGPVKATLTATVNDGYARLVFDMSEYDDASVRVANNVLVITFTRPIDVSVDRLPLQVPDYVGAARRDPDGKGIRVALSQQVKVNATPAAEKYFIDLLPTSWSGQPPSLPPEVIADLARRAREADRLERKERQAVAQQRASAEPVRVHVATQPTFTRYIFAIPANTSVSSDRAKERMTLTFDAPIKFDLADVVASLPRAIGGIDTELRDDSALVRFNFLANVDVRTFRDDGSYVLDIVGADNKPDEASAAPAAPNAAQQSAAPETTAPATVPPCGGEQRGRAQRRGGAKSAGGDGKTRRGAAGNNRRAGTTGNAAHAATRRGASSAAASRQTGGAESRSANRRAGNAASARAVSRHGKGCTRHATATGTATRCGRRA